MSNSAVVDELSAYQKALVSARTKNRILGDCLDRTQHLLKGIIQDIESTNQVEDCWIEPQLDSYMDSDKGEK